MVELRGVIILAVLMALVFGVVSEEDNQRLQKRHFDGHGKPWHDGSQMNHFGRPWRSSPANPFLPLTSTESSAAPTTTKSEPTPLEHAHWCRMNNGTYLALNQAYMSSVCTMCQCTKSHAIFCEIIQCMPTYCVDDKNPVLRSGQCCTQCDYDPLATGCMVNGTAFPHGAIIKIIERKIQCWCHLNEVECRNYMGTLFEGWSMFRDGTIYILVSIGIGLLIIGVFSFCCFSLLFYYYFKKNPQIFQQFYDQYADQSGWQPLEEEVYEEYEENTNADEKRLEAEQYQSETPTYHTLPPPYALYTDSETSKDGQK